jgi:mannosylfructose-phosphate synthase
VPGYPDVRIIRIPAGPWEFIPKETIYDVLPELTQNMIGFIRENGLEYDLFHGHYVDAGIVALDVAKELGKPCYFTAHSLGAWKRDQMGGDPDEMEEKFNFEHRISEEMRIFKTVNGQSLTSMVQYEKLKELYGFDAGNIEIISPGVDIHRYHPPENDTKRNPALPGYYIYCLSRLDTNKGHDLLLRAFSIVTRNEPDIKLIIGGGSPDPKPREKELINKLKTIIDEEGIGGRVQLTGYIEDQYMAANYQFSEFFVMPSLFEPFGMTSQEAMACGKPVIASRFGGIRNVIDSGRTGFLVDPTNAEEFAEVMLKLLRDQGLAKQTGLNARKLIMEEYSWEAIAGKHLDFFQKYL